MYTEELRAVSRTTAAVSMGSAQCNFLATRQLKHLRLWFLKAKVGKPGIPVVDAECNTIVLLQV